MIRGGDYAVNTRTGESRLVIEVSISRNEATFSGNPKWYSTKDWRTNARVEHWPTDPCSTRAEGK